MAGSCCCMPTSPPAAAWPPPQSNPTETHTLVVPTAQRPHCALSTLAWPLVHATCTASQPTASQHTSRLHASTATLALPCQTPSTTSHLPCPINSLPATITSKHGRAPCWHSPPAGPHPQQANTSSHCQPVTQACPACRATCLQSSSKAPGAAPMLVSTGTRGDGLWTETAPPLPHM